MRPRNCAYLTHHWDITLMQQVTRGVLYAQVEAEGKRLRNPFDTITEGVGLNRQTANFGLAQIDGAFHCSDREAVEMSSFLVCNDGLFLGSSSAVNCVGAVSAHIYSLFHAALALLLLLFFLVCPDICDDPHGSCIQKITIKEPK